ncbi:hypothetical protein [Dyadobacter sp. CY323]|uniref:hypothetical protein n=1 Tax=Dyadobacter sp. CY323 TaxID=2907302 RepID=UPI001F2D386A|nr:hypothetical protein [Dyadobacter sp. CY323]MCE6992074.1 hypothetical protein [Dyadobacter sp. CY323]
MQDLKTDYAISRENREREIYEEFQMLCAKPGAMKVKVSQVLCKKHNVKSVNTIANIRKRVESRLYREFIAISQP